MASLASVIASFSFSIFPFVLRRRKDATTIGKPT